MAKFNGKVGFLRFKIMLITKAISRIQNNQKLNDSLNMLILVVEFFLANSYINLP